MIPANQLRIGNKVYYELTGQLTVFTIDHGRHIDRYSHIFQPIPLTPELLEACGFERDYDGNLRKSMPARMELWFCQGNPAEMDLRQDGKYISFKCAHVKYLHELQNLCHALTGEELPVNLPV